MKLFVKNTIKGLVPCDDNDYEAKQKLKIGEVYQVTISRPRNYEFHKKYFALINCAWEYLNENQVQFFKNINNFRKTMELAAGHSEMVYSINRKEFIEQVLSIAFDKMDNDQFQDLYNRVFDVILKYPLKNISQEEFEKNLINF